MSSSALSKKQTSHKAKTGREWQLRLRSFAAGVDFGRGEMPRKNS